MKGPLVQLAMNQRVIVCCGAGGVGKTSVAAALALEAARNKKKVLVVTIDPSRRLAETLGVDRNPAKPIALPPEYSQAAGITPPGQLEAWMLDPQLVSDTVVRRFSSNHDDARLLLKNRIYRHVTSMIAGMQEYTAVEAMYEFMHSDRYDLIILDTPPSRNALHFLEAPSRISRFLDGRIFRFFVPSDTSFLKRATSSVLNKVLDKAFGSESRQELLTFFGLFANILKKVNRNAEELRQLFQRRDVSFVVITSPAQEALDEARYLERRTKDELKMQLSGFVLNRSLAFDVGKRLPDEEAFAAAHVPPSARPKVLEMAEREKQTCDGHTQLLDSLRDRLGDSAHTFAVALPFLPDGVADIHSLNALIPTL